MVAKEKTTKAPEVEETKTEDKDWYRVVGAEELADGTIRSIILSTKQVGEVGETQEM